MADKEPEKKQNQLSPFTQSQAAPAATATEKTAMAEATAEVMAAHMRAIQYPRNTDAKLKEIKSLCDNIYFASDAIYKITNRGEGLKVQTAKTIAQIWGNIRGGTVHHGEYGEQSQGEGWAIDLQNNFGWSDVFTVSHKMKANDNIVLRTDPADIYNLYKIQGSKSARNAILSVIPDWVQDLVKKWCKQTMTQEVKDVKEAWSHWQKQFEKIGVKPFSLLRWIDQTDVDKLTAAHIVDLRQLWETIKEDKPLMDEIFPERDKSKVKELSRPEGEEKPAPTGSKPPTSRHQKGAAANAPSTAKGESSKEPPATTAKTNTESPPSTDSHSHPKASEVTAESPSANESEPNKSEMSQENAEKQPSETSSDEPSGSSAPDSDSESVSQESQASEASQDAPPADVKESAPPATQRPSRPPLFK